MGAIYGPRDGDKKALSERNRPRAGNRPNRLSWVSNLEKKFGEDHFYDYEK